MFLVAVALPCLFSRCGFTKAPDLHTRSIKTKTPLAVKFHNNTQHNAPNAIYIQQQRLGVNVLKG